MMKKIGIMVLLSMVFLLGVASCASFPQLDLSTLDSSQPVEVGVIFMYVAEGSEFYQKYGESLRNSDALSSADADKLLEVLCGTTAMNWESIVETVKAKTGLVLNGERFMQTLEDSDSHNVRRELENDAFGRPLRCFYSWGSGDGTINPVALIGLLFDGFSGKIEVNNIIIETGDMDAFDNRTNVRQASIKF
jgi:hypothetical protein